MHGFEFLGIHFRFQVVHALCIYELKNEHCLRDFPCSLVPNFCNVLFLFFFPICRVIVTGQVLEWQLSVSRH